MSRSPRLHSARVRLLGVVVLVALTGLTAVGGALFYVQRDNLVFGIDERLRSRLDALAPVTVPESATAYLRGAVAVVPPMPRESAVGYLLHDDAPVAVPPGGILYTAILEPELRDAARAALTGAAGRAVYGSVRTSSGWVRYVAAPIDGSGAGPGGYYLRGVDLDADLAPLVDSIRAFAIAAATIVCLVAVAGWVLFSRLIGPVRLAGREADGVRLSALHLRLSQHGPEEFAPFTQRMNAMLDRLETELHERQRALADVRHDLRMPLTVVRGQLELLDAGDPRTVDTTRVAGISEIDRMNRLVDTIDLVLDEEAAIAAITRIDVAALTAHVGDLVAPTLTHTIAVERVAHCSVVGDADRLTEAWLQLIENAVKYAPVGTAIELGSDLDGDEVVLWVRDHGLGVAPDHAATVFERRWRAPGRDADLGSGDGLGLAIVRAIAADHLGRAEVSETDGGGATFSIRLPVDDAPRHATAHDSCVLTQGKASIQ